MQWLIPITFRARGGRGRMVSETFDKVSKIACPEVKLIRMPPAVDRWDAVSCRERWQHMASPAASVFMPSTVVALGLAEDELEIVIGALNIERSVPEGCNNVFVEQ